MGVVVLGRAGFLGERGGVWREGWVGVGRGVLYVRY